MDLNYQENNWPTPQQQDHCKTTKNFSSEWIFRSLENIDPKGSKWNERARYPLKPKTNKEYTKQKNTKKINNFQHLILQTLVFFFLIFGLTRQAPQKPWSLESYNMIKTLFANAHDHSKSDYVHFLYYR